MAAISMFWTLTMIPFFMDMFGVANGANALNLNVHNATSCPDNEADVSQRSKAINCTEKHRYMCLPNKDLTKLLEICHYGFDTGFSPGLCLYLDTYDNFSIGLYDCEHFLEGCPTTWDEPHKYPNCWRIENGCFSADISCMRSLAVTSDTTQSTLANKISNGTTADTNDREIDPLPILLPLIGILVIAVIITILAWKNKWRRKRCFGRKENVQPEEKDEELELLGTANNENVQPEEKDEELELLGTANNGIRQHVKDPEEASLLGTELKVLDRVEPDQVRQYLSKGELTFYHARGIIVGCGGAGKTTLLKRLMDTPFEELNNIESTEIVDVHVKAFSVLDNTLLALQTNNNNADQNQQIFQFSKEDITRYYPKTGIEENTKTRKHEKPCADDYEYQTLRKFTNVTPNSPRKDDEEESQGDKDNEPHDEDHDEHEDPKDTAEVETNTDMTYILDAVQKLCRKSNERKTITFLDFAGQSFYYAFHQVFISRATFSILVVDMRKNPEDQCEATHVSDDDIYCSRFESWTYKDFYRFWLQSIDSFCGTVTPVIVVGTHAEGKSEQECSNFFKSFLGLFDLDEDFHIRRHLHSHRCFAIKLPMPEKSERLEELSTLKTEIIDLVNNQLYWKRTVKPASAILEHILQENKERRIINKQVLLDHNERLSIEYRLDNSELTTLLKHLHEAGTLLYFEEPALKETIILDVQWLVHAFKSILAYTVAIENRDDIKHQMFCKTGELSNEELVAIWKRQQTEGKDYITHKDVLTTYMEKLGLLAVCNVDERLWFYFPSMNRRKFNNKQFEDFKKSSVLSFQFNREKQLPIFVFYRFVMKCMKLPLWKIHMKRNCKCIYDEVACFSFREHIVLLCIFNFQIQVQVCHPANDIKANLLKEIKSLLENTMEEFRNQNYEFDIGYKCQYGKFHDEELNFIPEADVIDLTNTDEKSLCKFCSIIHELGNGIHWESPMQNQGHSENNKPESDGEESRALKMGPIEKRQPESDGKESRALETGPIVGSRALSSNPYAATEEMTNLTRVC